jgi:hypothetical protein
MVPSSKLRLSHRNARTSEIRKPVQIITAIVRNDSLSSSSKSRNSSLVRVTSAFSLLLSFFTLRNTVYPFHSLAQEGSFFALMGTLTQVTRAASSSEPLRPSKSRKRIVMNVDAILVPLVTVVVANYHSHPHPSAPEDSKSIL